MVPTAVPSRFAVCFLCGGNHITKECKKIIQGTENPLYKCYNCASSPNLPHNHKANDVNCPFRAKYVAAKEQAKNKNMKNSSTKKPAPTNSVSWVVQQQQNEDRFLRAPKPPVQMSYAQVASQRNTFSHFAPAESNANENHWRITEVAEILRDSINELKQCKVTPTCLQLKKAKILLWNAQGISNSPQQLQLEHFAQCHKTDVILLVETFLKLHHSFVLNNFIVYRNDRLNGAHGGVAIAAHKSIHHKSCSPVNTCTIENLAVEIAIDNEPTYIAVAYCPKQKVHFEDDIRVMLRSQTSQYMVFGDFNAKHRSWNCVSNNKSGMQVYTLQQTNNFLIYNSSEHTHFPHSGQTPSTIDIALANVNFRFQLSTLPGQLCSDHDPVMCEIDEKITYAPNNSFNYRNADWKRFRRIIDVKLHSLRQIKSSSDIDDVITEMSNIMLDARSENIPVKTSISRSKISPDTKRMIQWKNKVKRQWQRSQNEPDKTILKSELNIGKSMRQLNRTPADFGINT